MAIVVLLKGFNMEKTTTKAIMYALLDKYEKSIASHGSSSRKIKVQLKMENYDEKYYDSREFERYKACHESIQILQDLHFVDIKMNGNFIVSIILNQNKIEAVYQWLGCDSIQVIRDRILNILETYSKKSSLMDVCNYLIDREKRFQSNKQYYQDENDLMDILKIIEFLHLPRDQEISFRQASQHIFNNTKKLERIQLRVIKLLKSVNNELLDISDLEIFEQHGIVRNPTFIYIKGSIRIKINEQIIDFQTVNGSLGLSSELLSDLRVYGLAPKYIMTVENLDSFHQISAQKGAVIYLGGFHNTAKQRFLEQIYDAYPDIVYYHFGDMDAGGFTIFHDLVNKTKIPFVSMLMDIDTLKKYHSYTQPLTEHDKRRLHQICDSMFSSVIEYMIKENIKLEQEIIDTQEFMMGLEED